MHRRREFQPDRAGTPEPGVRKRPRLVFISPRNAAAAIAPRDGSAGPSPQRKDSREPIPHFSSGREACPAGPEEEDPPPAAPLGVGAPPLAPGRLLICRKQVLHFEGRPAIGQAPCRQQAALISARKALGGGRLEDGKERRGPTAERQQQAPLSTDRRFAVGPEAEPRRRRPKLRPRRNIARAFFLVLLKCSNCIADTTRSAGCASGPSARGGRLPRCRALARPS